MPPAPFHSFNNERGAVDTANTPMTTDVASNAIHAPMNTSSSPRKDLENSLCKKFGAACAIDNAIQALVKDASAADNEMPSATSSRRAPSTIRKRCVSMLEMNEISEMVEFSTVLDEIAADTVAEESHPGLSSNSAANDDEGEEHADDDSDMFLIDTSETSRESGGFLGMSPSVHSVAPKAIDGSDDNSAPRMGMKRSMSMASIPSSNKQTIFFGIQEEEAIDEENESHGFKQTPVEPLPRSSMSRRPSSSCMKPLRSSLKKNSQDTLDSATESTATENISNTGKSMKRNISFSTLEIRSYSVTLGDQPSISGPPVSLNWDYDPDTATYDVDSYEKERAPIEEGGVAPRRSRAEMFMSASHRQYLLMREAGFSRREITKAVEEAQKIQKNRRKTKHRPGYMCAMEEAMEGMKMKKINPFKRKGSKK